MKAKLVLRGIAAGGTALAVIPAAGIGLYALSDRSLIGFLVATGMAAGLVYLTIRLLDAPEYPLAQQLADLPVDDDPEFDWPASPIMQTNPANGLPMVGATDIRGNPYGVDMHL